MYFFNPRADIGLGPQCLHVANSVRPQNSLKSETWQQNKLTLKTQDLSPTSLTKTLRSDIPELQIKHCCYITCWISSHIGNWLIF